MISSDKNLTKKIGLKIKLERTKRGLSQEKLAELSKLCLNSIGAIERGVSSATIDSLNNIASALEIPLEDLVNIKKFDL